MSHRASVSSMQPKLMLRKNEVIWFGFQETHAENARYSPSAPTTDSTRFVRPRWPSSAFQNMLTSVASVSISAVNSDTQLYCSVTPVLASSSTTATSARVPSNAKSAHANRNGYFLYAPL